jgi:lysophospholipase L1-like esterase
MKKTAKRILLAFFSLFLASLAADRALSLFGYPARPSIQAAHPPLMNEVREGLDYQHLFLTNSQGLRYSEIPLEPSPDELRVFVVGDSFTEGAGVNADKRFTNLLEDDFSKAGKKTKFINGGLSGVSPLEYGRIFFNVGLKYHPNALLICLYANDVINTDVTHTPAMVHDIYLEATGGERILHILWPHVQTMLRQRIELKRKREAAEIKDFVAVVARAAMELGIPPEQCKLNAHLVANGLLQPYYWERSIDLPDENAQAKFKTMIALLDTLIAGARERGITPALVYIPSSFQYDPLTFDPRVINVQRSSGVTVHERWLTETSVVQRKLAVWAQSEGLPYLDLTPALRREVRGRRLELALDGHWNAEGHKVAAKLMAEWIRKEKVFPLQ